MRDTYIEDAEDWTRLAADDDPDPDYAWIYYMSELKTQPYEHNVRFDRILEDLFDDFGVDLGNTLMDVNPTDVAGGYVWKEPFKIEHKQLGKLEVREEAEAALEKRYLKPWETSEDTQESDEGRGPDLSGENSTIIQIFID